MNEIRFDMEDLIETDLVDDLIYLINKTSEQVTFNKVVFWHNGRSKNGQIACLKRKLNDLLKKTILFEITTTTPQMKYIWFDVISDEKSNMSKSRFSYIYPSDKKCDLVRGIYNYSSVVNFIKENNQGKRIYYKPKYKSKENK